VKAGLPYLNGFEAGTVSAYWSGVEPLP
jgi:hypothetical protein